MGETGRVNCRGLRKGGGNGFHFDLGQSSLRGLARILYITATPKNVYISQRSRIWIIQLHKEEDLCRLHAREASGFLWTIHISLEKLYRMLHR